MINETVTATYRYKGNKCVIVVHYYTSYLSIKPNLSINGHMTGLITINKRNKRNPRPIEDRVISQVKNRLKKDISWEVSCISQYLNVMQLQIKETCQQTSS